MTLPEQMTNRWARRRDPGPREQTLYWHVLMRDYPDVGDLAQEAQDRLSPFGGLRMTPLDCLHMTTLVAGPAERFSQAQREHMIQTASDQLADVPPITVSLGKIVYHPEAILFAVTPAAALAPLRSAALAATRATGHDATGQDEEWRPHVTLCYSTSDQPARPIIDALGMILPERTITVRRLSLVIQTGSELAWDWTVVGTADLGASRICLASDQGGSSPLPDYPASAGTRRERFASPPAMACGHSRLNPAESRRDGGS